ncbi:hypothetical protein WJX79_005200 [Trebouxia sp. C0005]
MYRFVAVRHELPCMVRTNTDSNSDSPAGYLRTATAHTVPFYTKETAVSEPSSAEARPTMLHLVAAEWGTSVESLQVKRQCGPEWLQAILQGRPAPDCQIIPNSTSGVLGQSSGLEKSDGWTGHRHQGRRTRSANQTLQAKETTRGPAASQASNTDRLGVAAAITVSTDAPIPSSVSVSALNSSSAPVSSSLSPSRNPAGPSPPPSETHPTPSALSHRSTSLADVVPVPDGTKIMQDHSDLTYVHEIGAANSALDADACLMINLLFTPRGPSPECRTPSGDAAEAHPLGPMLLHSSSVCQTLMGITPDNSHTATDETHGMVGTPLEGAHIPRIDPSVCAAVMGVPVHSQATMSVAGEDFQNPLECSLDPQAAKSIQSGEFLTPVDGPLGDLQTFLDISPDSQASMITQSGNLPTPAGGPLCDVEFPMDDCSGASNSLMAAQTALPLTPVTHPSASHTSTHSTAVAELTTLSPEMTAALDEAPVVGSLPDAHTAGVNRQLKHLTSWGGDNIYLARDAALVTAEQAGHRMPTEKAMGLQMSRDSILAKWGQPCAPVSEQSYGSQSSTVELPQATPPHSTAVSSSHAPLEPQVKQSRIKKLGKKMGSSRS